MTTPAHYVRSWEASLAARSAGALFLLGGGLLATVALPQPQAPPLGVAVALGAVALLTGAMLLVADRLGGASIDLVYGLSVTWVLLVAGLVAVSGGPRSPYAAYYLFALIHVAAFQSPPRVAAMLAFVLAALLSPLAYDGVEGTFVTFAAVAIPPTIVAVIAVHAAMELLRGQQRGLERREASALALADQDPLTGLANYRVFQREVEASARAGEPFSLVLLDLDGFKQINDGIGHQTGDSALRAVAAALSEEIRADDVLCRQGGDEFAVIAARTGPEEAPELAGRLAEAVERIGVGRPTATRCLSATVGWATFGQEATTASRLVERADAAMRAAKRPSEQQAA